MKKGYVISGLVLSGILLGGCSISEVDESVKDVPVKVDTVVDNGPEEGTLDYYMQKVNKGELSAPGELNKDEYDVSKYTTKEKADYYNENSILVDEALTQKDDEYLVYYFSPLCVHCNNFYDVISGYEDLEGSYKIYKVNVDIKENLTAWNEIEGTPTLKKVSKGKDGKNVAEVVSIGYVELDKLPLKK